MSAPAKQSKADSKRARASDGPADPAASGEAEDRSVRQRMGPPVVLSAPASSAAAASAAVSSTAVTPLSFMRLAVVERQLIMQGLDISSLARLASTCRQLRAEALHREAGKFIPEPDRLSPLSGACCINLYHPAHASPLFRRHAPVTLSLGPGLKAPTFAFSRVTGLIFIDIPSWTDGALRLLSLPCMQEVTGVLMIRCGRLDSPPMQTALFGLPQLVSLAMSAGSTTHLLASDFAPSSKLKALFVEVNRNHPASVRSMRALRSAPALTSLDFSFDFDDEWPPPHTQPVWTELVWCLPPTLTSLNLKSLVIPHGLPRPLVKALFSRTPLLESVKLDGSIESSLRGLLDAGLHALPMLRQLRFREAAEADFSFDEDPDPIPAWLRRFLHRFPQAIVQFDMEEEDWEDPDQWSAMLERYLAWPRVELYRAGSEDPERIGGPPSPHSSDDDDGSDVEELEDPLASEAH